MCSGTWPLPQGKALPPNLCGWIHLRTASSTNRLTSRHTDFSSSLPRSPQGAWPEEPWTASLLQRAKALKYSRNIPTAVPPPQPCALLTAYSHKKLSRPSASSSQSFSGLTLLVSLYLYYMLGFCPVWIAKSKKVGGCKRARLIGTVSFSKPVDNN